MGHSYGGTVKTAVAEQAPDRIQRLVYLDASVPGDGESNNDVIGPDMAAQLRAAAMSAGEGWHVPPAPYVVRGLSDALRPWVEARRPPHPPHASHVPVDLAPPRPAPRSRPF